MILAVNGRIMAHVTIEGIHLRVVLGGYELVFSLKVGVNPGERPTGAVSISGAQISVRSDSSPIERCGFARPEHTVQLPQRKFPSSSSVRLFLPIRPRQLAVLETLRGTGDLDFDLELVGRVIEDGTGYDVRDTIRHHEARSDWTARLAEARARDVLLIEVALPITPESSQAHGPHAELRRAEQRFRRGDYQGCVASCRAAIEELGRNHYGKTRWANRLLGRLVKDRDSMSEQERQGAVWSAVRHYAHQAHHAPSEGGVREYSRTQAQWMLAATAGFVAHAGTA